MSPDDGDGKTGKQGTEKDELQKMRVTPRNEVERIFAYTWDVYDN